MKIGIIGPTGFSGSHTSRELLNRGHEVVGLSRTPEKLGKHDNYTAYPLALETAPIAELLRTFSGLDVLVNAYNPSPGPGVYKTYLETTRRILVAVKAITATQVHGAQPIYLIQIGGTASLRLPNYDQHHQTAGDSRPFWLAYLHATTTSRASLAHMAERLGPDSLMLGHLKTYAVARDAITAGTATSDQQRLVKETEAPIIDPSLGKEPASSELPLAARAAFMMFEDVPAEKMNWTFASPPARFRPGPSTGKYEVWVDELPLAKFAGQGTETEGRNEFDGRLLGVSAADLAVAIADEAEGRKLGGKHWSPVSEWEGDEEYQTYVRL